MKTTVAGWAESKPHVTEEEKSKLLEVVEKAVTWLDEKEAAQKQKKLTEDAVREDLLLHTHVDISF